MSDRLDATNTARNRGFSDNFQQADITPIDQDMFSNTFLGSGPRLKKRAVDTNLQAR